MHPEILKALRDVGFNEAIGRARLAWISDANLQLAQGFGTLRGLRDFFKFLQLRLRFLKAPDAKPTIVILEFMYPRLFLIWSMYYN